MPAPTGDERIDAALTLLLEDRGMKYNDETDNADDADGADVTAGADDMDDTDDTDGTDGADDADGTDDDIEAPATDQDIISVDESGQPEDPVDEAFKILVDYATWAFGFAPSDVYDGVFSRPTMVEEHASLKQFKPLEIVDIVRSFTETNSLDSETLRTLCVYPLPTPYAPPLDRWDMDYRSGQIGKEAVWLGMNENMEDIVKAYHLLKPQ